MYKDFRTRFNHTTLWYDDWIFVSYLKVMFNSVIYKIWGMFNVTYNIRSFPKHKLCTQNPSCVEGIQFPFYKARKIFAQGVSVYEVMGKRVMFLSIVSRP
jgi:hypothetical protein